MELLAFSESLGAVFEHSPVLGVHIRFGVNVDAVPPEYVLPSALYMLVRLVWQSNIRLTRTDGVDVKIFILRVLTTLRPRCSPWHAGALASTKSMIAEAREGQCLNRTVFALGPPGSKS